MGANHDPIKKEPKKDIKKKKTVELVLRFLHNMGMIKKLLDNYWVQCAGEAFLTFVIYFTIVYVGLQAIRLIAYALSN